MSFNYRNEVSENEPTSGFLCVRVCVCVFSNTKYKDIFCAPAVAPRLPRREPAHERDAPPYSVAVAQGASTSLPPSPPCSRPDVPHPAKCCGSIVSVPPARHGWSLGIGSAPDSCFAARRPRGVRGGTPPGIHRHT